MAKVAAPIRLGGTNSSYLPSALAATCVLAEFPRYKTPEHDREVLLAPAWEQLLEQLTPAGQRAGRDAAGEATLESTSFERLATAAREEALAAALDYTRSYSDVPEVSPDGAVVYTGHQPELVHPGVWLKNFLTARLAQQASATAIHLLIDCDQCVRPAIAAPSGEPAKPHFATIDYDQVLPSMPYEERQIVDARRWGDFPRAVADAMASYSVNPYLPAWWPETVDIARDERRLGHVIAKARHRTELAWGTQSLQLPQSLLCQTRSFRRFFMEIVDRRASFRAAYNGALADYRRRNRIRNAAQPLPDLAIEGEFVETPFWIYRVDVPVRRALYARRRGVVLCLSDLVDLEIQLPLEAAGNYDDALDALEEQERSGTKIRSRALTTTLYARMFLADLFLHGIGGGKYDQATEMLSQRFFGASLPPLAVASGTLRLGLRSPNGIVESPSTIRRRLREFQYHPETFLQAASEASRHAVGEAVAAKRAAIASPAGRDHGRERHEQIEAANRRLRELLAPAGAQLEQSLRVARRQQRAAAVLDWREYAFCLYPRERLRSFLLA